jgi:methyltransferase (TIGR00027 family)
MVRARAVRPDRPSETAQFVAFLRALGDSGLTYARDFRDPVAETLIEGRWRAVHRAARFVARAGGSGVLRRRVAPLVDVAMLRTLAIDEALCAAIDGGLDQLVILGAGLDARAYRLPALATVDVFEVDHPATQAYKRAKVAERSPLAKSLRFVGVDFERDTLADRLDAAGQDPRRPTAWIWEGVIVYLTDAALRSTLESVAARSAKGSRLLAQYREPLDPNDPVQQRLRRFVARVGEPHIGARARDAMRAEVERVGFRVLADDGADDWAARWSSGPLRPVARPTRLLVAERV